MDKLKVLELFAGIGACSKALERLGIEHEIVDAVEIDKYAMNSFNVIHGTNFETQDITQWDKDIEVDLIMHGSPCQDFSLAGKQAGGDKDSGTRSSLMYETIRIVKKLKPKYVIWENVKNLLSKNHKHNFDAYLQTMENLGYKNYYQVLNAKDYGIPQNRERVFTVSILNNECFEFPQKQKLGTRLKDILEDEVDEKYYLTNEKISKIQESNFMQERKRIQEKDYCDTLCARDWKDPKCVQVAKLDIKGQEIIKRVYSPNGISPTLTDMQGGNRQPKVMLNERN
jgi:DNA (cytosine-5)-methyltransferase 1